MVAETTEKAEAKDRTQADPKERAAAREKAAERTRRTILKTRRNHRSFAENATVVASGATKRFIAPTSDYLGRPKMVVTAPCRAWWSMLILFVTKVPKVSIRKSVQTRCL